MMGEEVWLVSMRFVRLVVFMLAVARGAAPACHRCAEWWAERGRQDADECVGATTVCCLSVVGENVGRRILEGQWIKP